METVLQGFSDTSKVWIYMADRAFTDSESTEIKVKLADFSSQWTSHGKPVYGKAMLIENRFILFVADESKSGVSGCSIDKTVAVVRDITNTYQVNLMDRSLVAIQQAGAATVMTIAELQQGVEEKKYGDDLMVYNTLLTNKAELVSHWLIPYKNSKFETMVPIVKFELGW
jgi:hypothetical protein